MRAAMVPDLLRVWEASAGRCRPSTGWSRALGQRLTATTHRELKLTARRLPLRRERQA